jgi:hypothetical protein
MAAPPASGSNSVATRVGAYNGWHASAEPHAAPRQPSTLGAQAARLAGGGSARGTATGTRHAAAGGSGSEIQIGAFADAAEARDNLASARRLSPRLLSDAEMAVPTVKVGGRTLYRARFVGLDAAAAASACAELRRHRIECLVTRTN